MSNRLSFYFMLVMLYSAFNAQISVKTNLPPQIKTNTEVNFEAKIWKGPIKNFSKYQMEVPEGVTITEIDCKTGSFAQEGNIVKIIWAITPSETEFTIQLKLSAGSTKGTKSIVHKYYYLEKGEKREVEMSPVQIDFVDNIGDAPVAEADPNALPSQDELKEQVLQLRKDAREAFEVGEAEKAAAKKKLTDAEAAAKKAKTLPNEKERTAALQKAIAARSKAETDLAMAERILILAKSLQDNADEIEKLNQSLELAGSIDTKPGSQQPLTASSEAGGTDNTVKPKVNASAIEKTKQEAIKKGTREGEKLYKPVTVNPHNIKEIIQQVEQIKKDSREAHQVGTREKNKAEQKLNESYEALKRAEYINDPEEKRLAIEKANQDKAKAEKDLEVAAKILTLAKSLEENAQEIEGLGDAEEENAAGTQMEVVANTSTITAREVPAVTTTKKPEKTEAPAPVKETVKTTPKTKPTETGGAALAMGTVYRLQVGAFEKTPDRSQFKSLGKVEVLKEGAMFKAFYGNFATREEAVASKEGVKAKGFDPFVVVFKDGVKVK